MNHDPSDPFAWVRQCSDDRLTELVRNVDVREQAGFPMSADPALREELDRRRTDSNSSLYRPTFF